MIPSPRGGARGVLGRASELASEGGVCGWAGEEEEEECSLVSIIGEL